MTVYNKELNDKTIRYLEDLIDMLKNDKSIVIKDITDRREAPWYDGHLVDRELVIRYSHGNSLN
jgi:hypothetical protein